MHKVHMCVPSTVDIDTHPVLGAVLESEFCTRFWILYWVLHPVPILDSVTSSGSCTRFWILYWVLDPVPILDSVPGSGSCTDSGFCTRFWILYQVLDPLPGSRCLDPLPCTTEIECCHLHCDLFPDTRNHQVQQTPGASRCRATPSYGPLRMEVESGIRANHITTNAASYSTRYRDHALPLVPSAHALSCSI